MRPGRTRRRSVADVARNRTHSLTATPSPEQLERERQVLELRQAGVDYATIAARVGYTNRGTAKRAFDRALARVHYPQVTQARDLEAARLDRLQAAHWSKALKGDDRSTGHVLRIIDLRIKLLGLSHADGVAERDARVNELQAALMAQTIRTVVDDLPLTEAQRKDALRLIAERVSGITRADEADVPDPQTDDDIVRGELAAPRTDDTQE